MKRGAITTLFSQVQSDLTEEAVASSTATKKGFLHPINNDRALLCAISHKIIVHRTKGLKEKNWFGQAVAVHGPLVSI